MPVSPHAGKPAEPLRLIDVPRLVTAYYTGRPDPAVLAQRVVFGTSGHRGLSLDNAFNQAHILAITQAICWYRKRQGIDGPLFIGMDTHAPSEPAYASASKALAANGVEVMVDVGHGYTPTPVISHAILTYNRGRTRGLADGIVITPSHNPPQYGGFTHDPPQGGPADTHVTDWIAPQVNAFTGLRGAARIPFERARKASTTHPHEYLDAYVADLTSVVDLEAIPASIDPTFQFMPVDWDGQIRMDPSSPYAMARLVGLRECFDIACASDTDADRHGVVSRSQGLLTPNQYLAVAIGKTIVSSSLVDQVAARRGRPLVEVPVGFKRRSTHV